jgi:hypothetical protein
MKFAISPFTIPDMFRILPGIDLRMLRCPDPDCCQLHGAALELSWGEWGIGFAVLFSYDDLA